MALCLRRDEQTELGIKDFVLQRIHPNAPWNENIIHTKQTELEDVGVSPDLLTARAITSISNNIDTDIKMTFDCPSILQEGCIK